MDHIIVPFVPKVVEGEPVQLEQPGRIISFKTEYWEHKCGGGRFTLLRGGSIECVWCGKVLEGVSWTAP